MVFALEEAYQDIIRLAYTSFDRIVIRGFVPVMQRPAGFVVWAQNLRPDQPIAESWIQSLARRCHQGVKTFAAERGIPIVTPCKKQRKHLLAETYRSQRGDEPGVYLIMRSREKAPVFHSRERERCPDPIYRAITRKDGYVDFYYFYIIDKYWGPISLKFSSHAPFNVTVFLNGNRWLAREAQRKGLEIRTLDNSIVSCDDAQALQSIADSLVWQRIQSVCEHWVYKVFPVFTTEQRRRSRFRYQWFVVQIEMSHNMPFKSPKRLTKILERHIDLNRKFLHPRSIKSIFCKVPCGTYKPHIAEEVRHSFGGLTVIRVGYGKTSIKQYNNHMRTFRTEVVCNDPKDLGLRKGLAYLGELRDHLLRLLAAFHAAQAPVLQTSCNGGELTLLAEPGSVGEARTPGIRLENERIMAVLAALPQLVHQPEGFRQAELREIISTSVSTPYRPTQAGYDLRKLRGKGLVERVAGRHRYRATHEGIRVAAFLLKLRDGLLEPILGNRRPQRTARSTREPDRTYRAIALDLEHLCEHLGLRAA
jgi:hypothetical protein